MKRFAVLMVAVACGRPTPTLGPIDEKPMTLTFAGPPAVGTKTTETMDYTMDLRLDVSIGSNSASRHLKGSGNSTRVEEVLAVANDAVTKLKVEYVDDTSTFTSDDGSPSDRAADPRTGNAYVLEASGGAVRVISGDGGGPNAVKKVEGDFRWLGKPESRPFEGSRTFNPGERVGDALYAKIKQEAATSGVEIDTADLVFRGQHDNDAVFDIDIKLSKSFELGSVALSLKGQLGFCLPAGNACDFAGSGELIIDAAKDDASIKGDGRFDGHVHRTRS